MLLGTKKMTKHFLPVFLLILSLSLLFSVLAVARMGKTPAFPSTIVTEGRVLLQREWGKRSAMLIRTKYGRVVAYVQNAQAVPAGSEVRLRAAVFDLKRAEDENGFDEFLFWQAKGAQKKIVLLQTEVLAPPTGLYKWRALLQKRIESRLPDRMSAYLLALTVGARDKDLSELHKRAGTVHLLAVSGFHVGIFAALCALLFRQGRGRFFAVTVSIWTYVLFAGVPVGGVRAALMIQICLLAGLFGKPASAFNGVSAAAVLMLLYNPWSYFDVGWRLSVLAALFLCAFFQAAHRHRFAALLASPLVWVVTASQSASVFKGVPLAGLLLNLLAVPLFGCLFPAILLLALPALIGLPFAQLFAATGEYFLEAWEIFSELFVSFFPYQIKHSLPLFLLSAVLLAVVVLRASGYSRQRSAAVLMLLPFLLFFAL